MSSAAWTPTSEWLRSSNSLAFARAHGLGDYRALLARSIAEPEWFWPAIAARIGIEFETPPARVLDLTRGPEFAEWFPGARLSLAWNCVDRHVIAGHGDRVAVQAEDESGAGRALTYAQLQADSAALADGLAAAGVGCGDRVALVLPMNADVITAFYAVVRLGAIAIPIFSGFSAAAIAARIADAGARMAITAATATRRGRTIDLVANVRQAIATAGNGARLVVSGDAAADAVSLEELRAQGDPTRPCLTVDANHPAVIAYTSGTTGRPKGAVLVHGGLLVKLAQEVHTFADIKQGEAMTWLTDMGWIMGPWITVGGHANGATVVLYDGAPDFPDPGRVWRLVERHRLAFLGVSPTLIRALAAHGPEHVRDADLSSLRAFGSTGEPWNPDPYRFLFDVVGERQRPVINISGGTEVGAVLLGADGAIAHDVCSLGLPSLGMACDVFDEDGQPIRDGSVGELVCTKPWPGRTRTIWGDDERYLATYWQRFPGVWCHGDWATVAPDGQWYLHGRSDDTLNVAGKRIGPAEFESALVAHPAVVEACAVGLPHDLKGETVHCLVVLGPGADPTDALREELRACVVAALGKAFAPETVRFVTALPKTRSAKIVRRAARAILLSSDPGDLSTLEDPTALDAVRDAR